MADSKAKQLFLFWACFIALVATAFGFIVRALIIGDWAAQFGLSATEQGEILGVGLWPFSISIILFSLIIDRIGYGTAMVFAFLCHVASAIITIWAPFHFDPYWSLYIGTLVVALGNGTVEAVINPVVATVFAREKTKWLNMLHAGWPGGLVLGGIITIAMGQGGVITRVVGEGIDWRWKVALILIPTVVYGAMMLACRFPVSERVAAGVPYRDMLSEFGAAGAYIVSALILLEIFRVLAASHLVIDDLNESARFWLGLGVALLPAITFGVYVRAIGRPLFIFMLLIMIPLATTELGTDSWITELMEPQMTRANWAAGWVLVYTSFIMMVLRFFAGPIVHRLSPLGLLATSAAVAATGLMFLSQATGLAMIFLAATVYGFGKTFFWPTMLGVVAEQSPKGGALTLNATGGVGMLSVGVIGAALLGYIQDTHIEQDLAAASPEVHQQVVVDKNWVFGKLRAVDPERVEQLPAEQQAEVEPILERAKQQALAMVAIFPGIMLVCYLILIAYFKSKGGYQAQVLTGHEAVRGRDEEFTGGVVGPVK